MEEEEDIVAVSFIGGGNRKTRRKPPIESGAKHHQTKKNPSGIKYQYSILAIIFRHFGLFSPKDINIIRRLYC
jgi:NADH:ubiquinone oxidoreductase subunit 3 (subunit A)